MRELVGHPVEWAIGATSKEAERRTVAIYKHCGVDREESLPIDDMLAAGVSEGDVTEWDRWSTMDLTLRTTVCVLYDGDDELREDDVPAPDTSGWAWRIVWTHESGAAVAVRYTDDPHDEWPVRYTFDGAQWRTLVEDKGVAA